MVPHFDPDALLAALAAAARDAGGEAMAFFRHGELTRAGVESKAGGSPVTEADMLVDRLLKARLSALVPEAGWLSEETADTEDRLGRRAVFIVDPIDGTRAFVSGDPRWAVSIALVVDGAPALGVLHLPALGETYEAARGAGARRGGEAIAVSARGTLEGARIAGPKPVLDILRQSGLGFEPQPKVPSLAYRFARVATGDLDAAVASTNAHDWDIAAADLILREAGGTITDPQGRVPIYNAPDPRHGVLAAAPLRVRDQLAAALQNGRAGAAGRQG